MGPDFQRLNAFLGHILKIAGFLSVPGSHPNTEALQFTSHFENLGLHLVYNLPGVSNSGDTVAQTF